MAEPTVLRRDSYGLGSVGGTQLPHRGGQVVVHGSLGEEKLSPDHTGAYQTAYQSVRPGPIKQVLRRTLDTLSAAAMRRRILADTEEVTGSNPVSPTKKALVSHPFHPWARARRLND